MISRQVDEILAEWLLPVRPLSLASPEPLENRPHESLNPHIAQYHHGARSSDEQTRQFGGSKLFPRNRWDEINRHRSLGFAFRNHLGSAGSAVAVRIQRKCREQIPSARIQATAAFDPQMGNRNPHTYVSPLAYRKDCSNNPLMTEEQGKTHCARQANHNASVNGRLSKPHLSREKCTCPKQSRDPKPQRDSTYEIPDSTANGIYTAVFELHSPTK